MPLPIRPNVQRMHPYSPGKPVSEVRRELGLERVYKLASNENPLGPSPKSVRAVQELALNMHSYPDGAAFDLKQALSARLDIGPDQIFLGNGSDECIRMLGWVLLDPEDEVIVGDPSFICYDETANLAPCTLIKVPLDANERHDLPAMAAAVTDRTKIIFIANPNNPTGTIVRRQELTAFLDQVPERVLVVLDEAYFEFAQLDPAYPDGIVEVKSRPNACVLRTFSKTYGLAGVRVGYGVGPVELVEAIQRARQPFNVNSLAQAAAIAALDDHDHLAATIANNKRGLERLSAALCSAGARVCESYANFVYADLGRPASPVFQALLERGIIVRTGEPFGRPNAIRVSVGTEEEMAAFEVALAEVLEPVKSL
jgi:histidinol-phosphate aminotransferase